MESPKRGPYAKGIEKRRIILQEALAAYGESDASGPSLRLIAARAGLSERGLLHYFASRDELLVAILEQRDIADAALFDPDGSIAQLSAVTERAAQTPGLVRLFSDMQAAAADENHAAHEYFINRSRVLRGVIARMLRRDAESGRRPSVPGISPEFAARILIAASDGLQQQWLLDPNVNLSADLHRLAEMFGATVEVAEPAERSPEGKSHLSESN